jgi:hypothetical protein
MHGSAGQLYIGEQGCPPSTIFFLIITQTNPTTQSTNNRSNLQSLKQTNHHQNEVLSRYRCHHGRLYHGLSCLGQALV